MRVTLPQPFLITENMWTGGCLLDCQRGRHRAVCGTNGRLYKSQCSFQRAQCFNTQLRGGGHTSPSAAIFVPECGTEGHFLPVQCHNQTGYCWCSTRDGRPIGGTSVLLQTPNCTGGSSWVPSSAFIVVYAQEDYSPQTCERERRSLLAAAQVRSVRLDDRFVPECTADGRYHPVQCHVATGYCWCVRLDTGRPIPGTSTSLVRALQQEAEHAGKLPPPKFGALRWHFERLDVDASGALSEREARPLRQFLRRRLKPRRCAKKFAQYCDRDQDRSLTLGELSVGGLVGGVKTDK
uniref:Thyroglobulin type-1 domain-containing protein n=1 Tax=Gadus morhua TaxID=8049 RepID=A0A8C4Z6Q7_GADMO